MGCRGCLVVLVILVLLLAALVGGTIYLLSQPSSLLDGMSLIVPADDSGASLDRKVDRFLVDVGPEPPDDSPEAILMVNEQEGTWKLRDFIKNGQFPIDLANPQAHFRDQRIIASADANVSGMTVNLAIEVRAKAVEGKPDVQIDRIDVGRISLPGLVRVQIVEGIASGSDPTQFQNLPFSVDGIDIADGVLTITGAARSD